MQVKTKIVLFGAALFAIIAMISVGIFYKFKRKNKVKEDILTLGSVPYLSLEGSLRMVTPSDKFKIIFFFNSECDHCQAEARLISANASTLVNADIYFFSVEEIPSIIKFANEFDLAKNPEFELGRVDYKTVIYKMGVNTYPMSFIYAPNGKLLRKYAGEVKMDAIVKYLQ
jgi:thiol-disulfide isomerase/thioredoxin